MEGGEVFRFCFHPTNCGQLILGRTIFFVSGDLSECRNKGRSLLLDKFLENFSNLTTYNMA